MQSFNELNLSPALNRALLELGFQKPSPIQAQSLPILLGGKTDFLGLAATGTGKTAAFALPLLEQLDPSLKRVQAMVLCPTRELAMQVSGQINLMGKYKSLQSIAIYGGADYGPQIHGLKQGAQIVVGTPGRVIDHLERGTLRLSDLRVLVLDEADEMISMGFREDLESIMAQAPRESSQIWLFSATMGREVRKVADTYLREPRQVQVNQSAMLSKTVEQLYFMTREADKPEILCKLIEANDNFYGLVFCQTKSLVTDLTRYLTERGYKADCLHGDMDQKARERTMQAFRNRKVTLLICTDVASRGLDVKDITHVINYSLPRELDSYVHRIGRTARSGQTGVAINLVSPSHRSLIGRIEKMTKSRMVEGQLPSRKEIAARKVNKLLESFQTQVSYQRAMDVLSEEWREALSLMAPEEVAARFLSLSYPELFVERPRPPKPQPAATKAHAHSRTRPHTHAKEGKGTIRDRFKRAPPEHRRGRPKAK